MTRFPGWDRRGPMSAGMTDDDESNSFHLAGSAGWRGTASNHPTALETTCSGKAIERMKLLRNFQADIELADRRA